jgi:type II secretory pathway pseudopilin PulG
VNALVKIVATTVAVVALACAATLILLPPFHPELDARRNEEAQRFLDQVAHATWRYFSEHGEFPPGDGIGSAHLARALRKPSRTGQPYLSMAPALLSAAGDIRNPIAPESSILHYRNNRTCAAGPIPIHNLKAFDLWCRDVEGGATGLNNWDRSVSQE